MIIFVGTRERGFFCEDVASKIDTACEYVEANIHIDSQVKQIMDYKEKCEYLVFDIEQYADDAEVIIDWILKIRDAVNCKIIIYAVSYSPQSELVSGLYEKGIKNYIFSSYLSDKKEDLELCITGYFENFGYEDKRGISFNAEEEQSEDEENRKTLTKTIGIAGSIKRMGTTTQALQIVKYLLFKGYKAAYYEMNNHKFVEAVADAYSDVDKDDIDGVVKYQKVDMYYKADKLKEVQNKDYDFIVYDFGVYSDHDFNKVSFLEKDIQIFVVGSKPDEFSKTYNVIKNNFYNNVFYIFNFTSDTEKKDLLELMEDKSEYTFFADTAKDPFTFGNPEIYEKMIPLSSVKEEKVEKRGFFRRRNKNG